MILILGSSGLLGNAIMRKLDEHNLEHLGTKRGGIGYKQKNCFINVEDLTNNDELEKLINTIKPTSIVNCLSLSSEIRAKKNWAYFLRTYSILPRVLNMLSMKYNFKFIQISSDGVFNGKKGSYKEKDKPNANDIYGLSKILGEPNFLNTTCIRTSIYGHSVEKNCGLIDWVLSQEKCHGYSNYIFTGISTVKLSDLIIDVFLKEENFGLFHIGGERISKYDLLKKIITIYNHDCDLINMSEPTLDLSLNQTKFRNLNGKSYFDHDTMLNELYVQYT